jgi:glucose/arabinose dehydrogenase/PKD repeat protein
VRDVQHPVVRLLIAAVAFLGAIPGLAEADPDLPSGFQDSVTIDGLQEPTTFRFAPDGRVFVAEKAGRVLVYDDLEDETPTLFADLRTKVYDAFDRGLLGMALDPQFPTRPYVYVLYTYDHVLGEPGGAPRWGEPDEAGDECPELKGADDCLVSGRLSRLTATGDQMTAEDVLVEDWCQQFSSHSIGDLEFADGALYASGGEGASWTAADYGQFGTPRNPCGDPPGGVGGQMKSPTAEGGALRSQDLRTPSDPTGLDGTIIRIDPDTGAGLAGNPLSASGDANARRVVAYGFRNPFRFAIDPNTDELYVGNVGWGEVEEIDRLAAVPSQLFNSGWPCYEGSVRGVGYEWIGLDICEDLYEGEPGSTTSPFFEYDHGEGVSPEDPCPPWSGSAISGIAINDAQVFPDAYDNALFFADSVRGCIYAMLAGEDERPDPSTVFPFATDAGLYPGVDLRFGPDGALYYVSMFSEDWEPGAIHRVEYFSANQPPIARLTADPEWGTETSLEVHLDASESSDPDDDPLAYEWDLDGDGEFDAASSEDTATETYDGPDSHEVAVRVADPHGGSNIARVTVYPGETPPQPEILTPEEDFEWGVGDEIEFEGEASDAQDGDLPATSLDWTARLFHCPDLCHPHQLPASPGAASGDLTAPDHDYPTWIELTLTAKDSRDLSGATTLKIEPRTVDLAIDSEPTGLSLGAGLMAATTPFVLRAIEGSNVSLVAPQSQSLGGLAYNWLDWSDGGERVHQVIADAPNAYTATYQADATVAASSASPSSGPSPGPSTLQRLDARRAMRRGSARFWFSMPEGGSGFLCKLDRGSFAPCRSPRVYRDLKPGRHVFRVLAVDSAGAPVSERTVYRWRVPKPPRD